MMCNCVALAYLDDDGYKTYEMLQCFYSKLLF